MASIKDAEGRQGMDWLAFAPTALVAVLVVVIPGAVLGYVLRLRGIVLWGFAPAAGVGVLAVSATALGVLGVDWSPLTALAVMVTLTVLAWGITRLLRVPRVETSVTMRRGVIVALVVGALVGAARMAFIIGIPENVSQTNDATFHLNVLRYIADTGSASSFDLLGTTGASGFYPGAWHAVASLTMQLTGADVAAAANAVSLAIAGPLWTLSISAFVWAVTRDARATTAGALLAPVLFAFPFHMLDFGVLYPYALSLAILPGTLAVLVASSDDVRRGARFHAFVPTILATLVGFAALGFSQPSVLLVWVVGAVALVLTLLLASWRALSSRARWVRGGMAILIVASASAFWLAMVSISSENLWPGIRNATDAAARMLVNGSVGPGPSLILSALAVLGFALAVRTVRLRWLALFAAALAILVLVAQSVQNDTVRMLLSPWYADPRRFTAMMPLIVIPLAAVAVASIARWSGWRNARSGLTVASILVVLVYLETLAWAIVNPIEHRYGETARSYLSADERALLDDLEDYVGPDARVLGNPSAGAAFGYGLSGVDVIPRTWAMPPGEDFQTLRDDLADLEDDPQVCPAVEALGVDYVLDFGESEEGPGKWEMPGLTGFSGAAGFTLVAERGDASLWLITGCD